MTAKLVVTLLTLILKNLPLIIGLLRGLGRAVGSNTNTPPKNPGEKNLGYAVDQEDLAKIIEERVNQAVTKIVNENRTKIKVWVPTEDEKRREARLDELEALFTAQMKEDKSL